MGRWFGYRVGYEDLVRIFMPKDQILWFEGVYKLEMDLRKNVEVCFTPGEYAYFKGEFETFLN